MLEHLSWIKYTGSSRIEVGILIGGLQIGRMEMLSLSDPPKPGLFISAAIYLSDQSQALKLYCQNNQGILLARQIEETLVDLDQVRELMARNDDEVAMKVFGSTWSTERVREIRVGQNKAAD